MNPMSDTWVGLGVVLLVILPIVVLIAGSFVALFVAKNKVVRTIAAVVVVTFGILIVGGMLVVPAITLSYRNVQETKSDPVLPSEATWEASTEEALRASIYSSPESAARALTQSCLDSFQADLSEQPAEIRIYVGPQAKQFSPGLGVRIASFLSERFPHSSISELGGTAPDPLPQEVLCIAVEMIQAGTSPRAPWDPSSRYTQGQIRLIGDYRGSDYQNLRRFVEKPWVDHFDDFVSQRPGRRLMRANSNTFSISEQESDRSARQQAASLITPILEKSHGIPRGRALDLAVQAAIDNNEIIVDRFSQKLSSQSGDDVWRTTLLIDARPETLARIIHEPGSDVRNYEYRRRSVWIGISVVLALTVFLYFVLDELTKGYFVWNLRVTALLTMLTLAVVFCWWMNAMT